MTRKVSFSLQTLIIAVLFTALSLEFGVTAWITYDHLKTTILSGFDKKLDAISTTSGLFVDGDEHRRIFDPRDLKAIALDTKRSRITAVDNRLNGLVSIDKENGGASDLSELNWVPSAPQTIMSIAYSTAGDLFYALAEDGRSIFSIAPESGRIRPVLYLSAKVAALAYRETDDALFGFGEQLTRIDLKKRRTESNRSVPLLITGAAWDSKQNRFLVLQGSTGKVLSVSESAAEPAELGDISTVDAPESAAEPEITAAQEAEADEESEDGDAAAPEQWKEPEVVVLPAGGLILDAESNQLYASTDRLIKVSAETGHGNPAGFRMGFRNEASELYKNYADRMKRVMDAAGLTYHYTIVLPKENQLVYVIDATQGEDHSTLGTEEEVEPEEWARLNAVSTTGIATQSKVKHFDLWGLLKVGTAAIRDNSGHVVGLMGADVNISIINKKTRIALIRVLGLAILGLLVAGAAAVWIARDLGTPMRRLKEGILRVAAGEYSEQIQIQGPKELMKLAKAFDTTREKLHETVTDLDRKNAEFERGRRRHLLETIFVRDVGGIPQSNIQGSNGYIVAERVGRTEGKTDLSGCVRQGERGILWIGETSRRSMLAAKRKSDIALICERLLAAYTDRPDELPAELFGLLPDDVSVFLVFDLADGKIVAVSQSSVSAPLVLVHGEQGVESRTIGDDDKIDLGPGESMFLSTVHESERTTRYLEQLTVLWAADRIAPVMHAEDNGVPDLNALIESAPEGESGGGHGSL